MAYLVLARKYRPHTFADVAGQEVATKLLQGAIREQRVGHAYLFNGPRGTGKTTTARILAKALNCEQGPAEEPCGTCERCLSADRGSEVDIIEIDAASNTGVDDVRELREQVAFAPMRARYKVYIVDEVHMLSTAAFNALLKTLEEPPPHVKFFFATTELHKVPDTILSRCQVVKLGLINEETIAKTLDGVLAKEGIRPAAGVTHALARAARGSMRDGLSLTDQLLALVGQEPQVADVARLAGPAGAERIEELASLLEAGDGPGVLRALGNVGFAATEVCDGLLEHLRAALIAVLVPERAELLGLAPEERERAAARAKRLGGDRLQIWLDELIACRERMQRLSEHAALTLEVTLLELCRPEAALSVAELEQRLLGLEERLGAGGSPTRAPAPGPQPAPRPASRPAPAPASAPAAPAPAAKAPSSAADATAPRAASPEPTSEPAPERGSAAAVRATQQDSEPTSTARRASRSRGVPRSTQDAWKGFLAELGTTRASLAQLLGERGRLVEYRPGAARIQLARLTERDRALAFDAANLRACNSVFSELAGQPVEVTLEDTAGRPPGRDDVFTREVADLFGGQIED